MEESSSQSESNVTKHNLDDMEQASSPPKVETALSVKSTINNNIAGNNDEEQGLSIFQSLNEAIDMAKTPTPVPILEERDIAPPATCIIILSRFKYPLISLFITTSSAIAVVYTANPEAYRIFPYCAATLNFCGGVPSIKASLDKWANCIIPRLETTEDIVKREASELRKRASCAYYSYTDFLRCKKEQAMERMRFSNKSSTASSSLLSSSNSSENLLSYDPPSDTTQILDTQRLTGETKEENEIIDDSEQPSTSHMHEVMRKKAGKKYVPIIFRSKLNFDCLVTLPLLLLALITQQVFVHIIQVILHLDVKDGEIRNKWSPLLSSSLTWLLLCFQIFIFYSILTTTRMVQLVNKRAKKRIDQDLNSFKRQVAQCLEKIKMLFLALMQFLKGTTMGKLVYDKARNKVKKLTASIVSTKNNTINNNY